MTHDICIIGHVTEDRIEIAGRAPRTQPGGTAYYAGIAARRLGLATAVLTKLHADDQDVLLADLPALGISTVCLPSPATTRFVNSYPDAHAETRVQRLETVALPFLPEDLTITARLFLLGVLTRDEITPACLHALSRRGGRIALDLQGLLRATHGEQVVLSPNPHLATFLESVDILKASREEALYATGAATSEAAARQLAAAGPSEVIVTAGSQGSLLLAGGQVFRIPAYPPAAEVDSTGCGDTYFAAYLFRRLAGDAPEAAGHFAATVASAKLGYYGAFRGLRSFGAFDDPTPRPAAGFDGP